MNSALEKLSPALQGHEYLCLDSDEFLTSMAYEFLALRLTITWEDSG